MYQYRFPHPAVAADICMFSVQDTQLCLLLIERARAPFQGMWAIPGGFLEPDEDLDNCARRELREETGIDAPALHQFAIFSDPKRDPRERIISVAYLGLVVHPRSQPHAASDAAAARWFPVNALPLLAFDHATIVARACAVLSAVSRDEDLLLRLCPHGFDIARLRQICGTSLGA